MATKNLFSADFLKKIKKLLEEQKAMLEKQLAKLDGKGDGAGNGVFPDYGDTEEDNAQEVADYETNLSVQGDLGKSLRDVVASLDRIAKGTYGSCRYCKKQMDEKRLLARPTSSACVECKKAIVQEV